MKEILAYRASSILYDYLKSKSDNYIVILPANICSIVFLTVLKANKKIELVDIDDTLHVDLNIVEEILVKNENVILLYVRPFGYINDSNDLKLLKSKYDKLKIIDDRCLCKPEFSKKLLLKFVELTLFSTGYSKYVELTNGGGLGFLNREVDIVRESKGFDQQSLDYQVERIKESIRTKKKFEYIDSNWLDLRGNKKLSKYKICVKNKLPLIKEHKDKINKIYCNELGSVCDFDDKYNDWRFNIMVEDAEDLEREVFSKGFFVSRHYSDISCLLNQKDQNNTVKYNKKIINLFNDFHINENVAYELSLCIRRYLK